MTKTLLVLICLPLISFGQTSEKFQNAPPSGIHFESGLTWDQVKEKAKSAHKYIFIDCYATWCGPCKYMSKNIFTLPEVGDFFNTHFISIQLQMDRTDSDAEAVRNWYQEAKNMETIYTVNSLPTFLFFSPDGQPVHRMMGSTKDGKEFIAKAENALDTNKQYYRVVSHYKEHIGDSSYLRKALLASNQLDDKTTAVAIGDYYLNTIKNPYQKDNLFIVMLVTTSTSSKGFNLLYEQPAKADQAMKKGFAESILRNVIAQEEVEPSFNKQLKDKDWRNILQKVKKKYPLYADRVVIESKTNYYAQKRDWRGYGKSTVSFLNAYGPQLDESIVNYFCWEVFKHCSDRAILNDVSLWIKRSVDKYPDCIGNYIDTYANLLYKLGDVTTAIEWEQKALGMPVSENTKEEFRMTLDNMKRGIPTWPS